MSFSATYINANATVRDDPTESPLVEPNGQVYRSAGSYAFAGGDQELTGKVYFEIVLERPGAGNTYQDWYGIVDISSFPYTATDATCTIGAGTDSWGAHTTYSAGNYYLRPRHNGVTGSSLFTGLSPGDHINIAFDKTAGKIWFGVNGTWSGDPAAGTGEAHSGISGTTFVPGCTTQGNLSFNYQSLKSFASNQDTAAPSGFAALPAPIIPGTANLALAGSTPTAFSPLTAEPGTDALTLTGAVPSIDVGIAADDFPEGELTLTGAVPTLREAWVASPADGTLTTAGYAALVDDGLVVSLGVGTLALTGSAPTIENLLPVPAPASDALALTGAIPGVFLADRYSGDNAIPAVVGEVTADFGNVFAGDGELAPLEGTLLPGWQGSTVLPAVAAEATYSISFLYAGDGTLPAITGSGSLDGLTIFAADIALQPIEAGASSMLNGLVLSADLSLAPVEANATLLQQLTFTADITLPAIQSAQLDSAVLLTGSFFQGSDLTLPAVELLAAYSDATTLTYKGLSTNTFVLGHSTYVNTNYDGLGRLGTSAYAAMSDGLYRLNGEDDAGVPIEAYFLTGYEDFGNEATKTQRIAYLGCASDGPLELLIRVDKDGDELYSYSIERPHEDAQSEAPLRVKLGRGLKGRYWQVGLRNCDGAHFQVDRLGLGVNTSTRKR